MDGKPDWLSDFPVQIYCNRNQGLAQEAAARRRGGDSHRDVSGRISVRRVKEITEAL